MVNQSIISNIINNLFYHKNVTQKQKLKLSTNHIETISETKYSNIIVVITKSMSTQPESSMNYIKRLINTTAFVEQTIK